MAANESSCGMKSRIYYIWMLMIVAGFLLEAPMVFCKTKSGPATLLTRADRCRKALYESSKKRKYRHNWLKCIRRYEKLCKVYPKSEQAVWARYHSANLYAGLYRYSGKSKDLNEALTLYRSLAINIKIIVWQMMLSIRSAKYFIKSGRTLPRLMSNS